MSYMSKALETVPGTEEEPITVSLEQKRQELNM